MGNILTVAKCDNLDGYLEVSKAYNTAFELNDFFIPDLLDDEVALRKTIETYKHANLPEGCTMHGVFFDIVPFSSDARIRKVSWERMEQSMEIARELGLKGVVFHTNCYPLLSGEVYNQNVISGTVACMEALLAKYPDIHIYLENMFDGDATIMAAIAKALQEYPNFGLCLDYAHASISGTSIEEWVKAVAPYIKHLHINDNNLKKDQHLAVGEGRIDWDVFLDYYEQYFRECSVLVEVNDPDKQRKSLDYIADKIRKIDEENHRMKEMNENKKKRPYTADELLERIFYYVNELANVTDFESSIVTLTNLGRDMVNSERASFWFWDTRKKQYWTIAAIGREQIIVPEGSGIIGVSIQKNEVVLINDPYNDARFNSSVDKETGFVTKSILCIPVLNTQGKVIGAYQAINKLSEDGDSDFTQQDIKRLSMAAMFCGKTLESQILYKDAHMDQLTGLKNRRGFHEYYKDTLCKLMEKEVASIIMCDIDHFKHVNDTYGHNAGDAVLVHVANHLQESVDGIGEVIRWGGEEFILLLPKKNLEQTVEHAENLRKKIEASVCTFEDTDIKVTMSFGVKELEKDLSADMNVELADEKLYKAKTGGRNQVVYK